MDATVNPCQSYAATYRDGDHRWDPVEFRTYETDYVCLDCGEKSTQCFGPT